MHFIITAAAIGCAGLGYEESAVTQGLMRADFRRSGGALPARARMISLSRHFRDTHSVTELSGLTQVGGLDQSPQSVRNAMRLSCLHGESGPAMENPYYAMTDQAGRFEIVDTYKMSILTSAARKSRP